MPSKQEKQMSKSLEALKDWLGSDLLSKADKVLGKTTSGKPVYSKASHPSHASFTPAEHKDAIKVLTIHQNLKRKAPGSLAGLSHLRSGVEHHQKMINEKTKMSKGLGDLEAWLAKGCDMDGDMDKGAKGRKKKKMKKDSSAGGPPLDPAGASTVSNYFRKL